MRKQRNTETTETPVTEEATLVEEIAAAGIPSEVEMDMGSAVSIETVIEAEAPTETESAPEIEADAADVVAEGDVEAAPVTPNEASDAATAGETSTHKITDQGEIIQALEAVIFASPKAMTLVRLRNLLNSFDYDTTSLVEHLRTLETKYADSGMQLVKVAGGWQFRSHPKNSDLLQKLLEDKPARLSPSALEVLAIVAYKQPVTRAEIDVVRGIDSGHLMKGLLEKNLVRTTGHAETPGRPLLYGTTAYFLEVFTLGSLDELPAMDEFQRELVRNDAGGDSGEEAGEGSLLTADPSLVEAAGFHGGASPLAAEPDRGAFDQPSEETADAADFGLAERAQEANS